MSIRTIPEALYALVTTHGRASIFLAGFPPPLSAPLQSVTLLSVSLPPSPRSMSPLSCCGRALTFFFPFLIFLGGGTRRRDSKSRRDIDADGGAACVAFTRPHTQHTRHTQHSPHLGNPHVGPSPVRSPLFRFSCLSSLGAHATRQFTAATSKFTTHRTPSS
jgi:hypothetical protein